MATTILIVGDWIIDDYDFVRATASETASSRGLVHYELLSAAEDRVRDLCGAGHIAHVLCGSVMDDDADYQVIGLGKWNGADSNLIEHLSLPSNGSKCRATMFGYGLNATVQECRAHRDPSIFRAINLAPDGPTLRVVRAYSSHSINRIQQLTRLDLRREVPPTDRSTLDRIPFPETVDMVIIHDMAKGTVDPPLVEFLAGKYGESRWMIRSKSKDPEWLRSVRTPDFVLLGPEYLYSLNPFGSAVIESEPTPDAMHLLEDLMGTGCRVGAIMSPKGDVIAAFAGTTGNGFHAMDGQDGPDMGLYIGRAHLESDCLSELRRASGVFASAVLQAARSHLPLTANDLDSALDAAPGRIGTPEIDVPAFMAPTRSNLPPRTTRSTEMTSWSTKLAEWDQSKTEFGLITDPTGSDPLRLDIWRGWPVLPGYITIVQERRKIVRELGTYLRDFAGGALASESLKLLITADPGTGKTALAQSLARAVGAQLLTFDVAGMVQRADLIRIFDSIAVIQASKEQSRPLLVFVDEINTPIEGAAVYNLFLGPLEAGTYVSRSGTSFQLRPCAWIFAGTGRVPSEQGSGKEGDVSPDGGLASKFSDFRSRISAAVDLSYRSIIASCGGDHSKEARVEHEAKLEQVYMGAMRIVDAFPHVDTVAKELLEFFYSLNPAQSPVPSRVIRRLALDIVEVHGTHISRANCGRWMSHADWKGWSGREDPVRLRLTPE